MSNTLGANFRDRKSPTALPKKIEISSIKHNIYFLKKGRNKFPSAKFLGMHPKSNKILMLFGKADSPTLFAGNTNNELLLCKRGVVTQFKEQDHHGKILYHAIEFTFNEKMIVITIPADSSDTYLYSDNESPGLTQLKSLQFKFSK